MISQSKVSAAVDDERIPVIEKKIEALEQQLENLQKKISVLMDLNGVSEEDIATN